MPSKARHLVFSGSYNVEMFCLGITLRNRLFGKLIKMPGVLSTKLCVALVLLFAAASWVHAQNLTAAEKQKIESLIKEVRILKDARFIRNGSSYSAENAATFLRRKWQANDTAVKTARDFIEKVGSFSGISGKPYLIRFRDGKEIRSQDFLFAELRKMENARAQGQRPSAVL